MTDTLDRIIAYEQGDLDEDEVIALFQDLVNTDLVWQLQGHYGRTAISLLASGLVEATTPKAQVLRCAGQGHARACRATSCRCRCH